MSKKNAKMRKIDLWTETHCNRSFVGLTCHYHNPCKAAHSSFEELKKCNDCTKLKKQVLCCKEFKFSVLNAQPKITMDENGNETISVEDELLSELTELEIVLHDNENIYLTTRVTMEDFGFDLLAGIQLFDFPVTSDSGGNVIKAMTDGDGVLSLRCICHQFSNTLKYALLKSFGMFYLYF